VKITDIDAKYILVFIVCKIFHVVDIRCRYCYSLVIYILYKNSNTRHLCDKKLSFRWNEISHYRILRNKRNTEYLHGI